MITNHADVGDLRLDAIIAGRPSWVRTAFGRTFARHRIERAAIFLRRPIRLRRYGWITAGTYEFKLAPGTKAGAEAQLARFCESMRAEEIEFAQRLIDAIHTAATNRSPIAEIGSEPPRFWLELKLRGNGVELTKDLGRSLRKDIIGPLTLGIFLREGRPPTPQLRWLAPIEDGESAAALSLLRSLEPRLEGKDFQAARTILERLTDLSRRALEARSLVVEERTRAVFRDQADQWLDEGSILEKSWMSGWGGSYWTALLELDFIRENFSDYMKWRDRRSKPDYRARFDAMLAARADECETGTDDDDPPIEDADTKTHR